MENNIIYICVMLTDYGCYTHATLSQRIGKGPLEVRKLDWFQACKLMWELKLAGGEKMSCINRYDHHIHDVSVHLRIPF